MPHERARRYQQPTRIDRGKGEPVDPLFLGKRAF
jgi:hypothetical protein